MVGFAIGAWLAIAPSMWLAAKLGGSPEVTFAVGLGQAIVVTILAIFRVAK